MTEKRASTIHNVTLVQNLNLGSKCHTSSKNKNTKKNEKKDQKKVIEKLQQINGDFNHLEQASNLNYLLGTVSNDIYPDAYRFIIEFIQNCDDSGLENSKLELEIHLNKKDLQITFFYNGKEFTQDDVYAICSAGKSTKKKDAKLTGYKGIGFKSVFSNSNKVTIFSGGYQFRFDKEACLAEMKQKYKDDSYEFPWQFYPIWTEVEELNADTQIHLGDFSVSIIIDICDLKHFEECMQAIVELQQNQAYLLFLKSKNILIKVYDIFTSTTKELYEIKKFNHTKHSNIFYFDSECGSSTAEKYYIQHYTVDLSKESIKLDIIKEDTKLPDKLKDISRIDIGFAAKIKLKHNEEIEFNDKEVSSTGFCGENNNNQNEAEERDNSDYDSDINIVSSYIPSKIPGEIIEVESHKRFIYSYLPTKVNYNFPFLVNSNFILDAGRTQIKDHYFNELLFSLLPKYITCFYNDIKKDIGNSYANILFKDHKIEIPKFRKAFEYSVEVELKKQMNNITVFTKGNTYENRIDKIYYDNFCSSLKLEDDCFKYIENYFMWVYYDLDNSDERILNTKFENNDLLFIKQEIAENYNSCISHDNLMNFSNFRKNENIGVEKIKLFIKEKLGIDLNPLNRINIEDKAFVDKIHEHYNVPFVILDESVLFLYIESDYYEKNYSHKSAYNMVLHLRKSNEILAEIKNRNLRIFKDKMNQLNCVRCLFFYNLKAEEEYYINLVGDEMEIDTSKNSITNNICYQTKGRRNNSILSVLNNENTYNDKNKNNKEKERLRSRNEIDESLLFLFLQSDNSYILEKLGVTEFSDNSELEDILQRIKEDYSKKNSFLFVKILIKKYIEISKSAENINRMSNSDTTNLSKIDKVNIDRIIDTIKNINLITKSGKFIHPFCTILGKEYTKNDDFKDYQDFHLSEKYIIPSIQIESQFEFFKKAGLWFMKKDYAHSFNKQIFLEYPFLEMEFIKIFKDNSRVFKKKGNSENLFISPDLNFNFYRKPYSEIEKFFCVYAHYLIDPPNILKVNQISFNYFKWFLKNYEYKIPSNKKEIKSSMLLYSYDLIKDFPEELNTICLQLFEFPSNIDLFMILKEAKIPFKLKFENNDIIMLLDNIQRNESNFKSGIGNIKQIYQEFLFNLSKTDVDFQGYFLDEDYGFTKAEDAYYFLSDNQNEIIEKKVQQSYKKLLVPIIKEDLEVFIRFAQRCHARIYREKDFKYKAEKPIRDKEFNNHTDILAENISKICKVGKFTYKDKELIRNRLSNVEIFACSDIKLELKKQTFQHGLSFYKIENGAIKIYYLKNDLYNTFKHPSIAYYMAYFLSIYLKCERKKSDFIPLIMNLGNTRAIEEFINSI